MGKRLGMSPSTARSCTRWNIIDGGNQTHPNFPCWVILDSQAREKYRLARSCLRRICRGLGVKADSIPQLAGKIGVDSKGCRHHRGLQRVLRDE